MPYEIVFTPKAQEDVMLLQKHSPNALKKLAKLLEELRIHPKTGTGQVEQLRHYDENTWSRRITKEHRLVYQIHDSIVEVLVISAFGHYAK